MRPRLLDLFCCEGGAGRGYADAGFDVVGVDIEDQPRYPFEFIHADVLELVERGFAYGFDAIHASPPCQAYTKAQRIRANNHPDMIAVTRRLLKAAGLPYIIENVPTSPLVHPVELCGTMFGLPLYRHRWFECSFPVTPPLHGGHWLRQVKMGRKPSENELHQPVGHFSDVEGAREAMGMPWASQHGLAEAVPPAYTRFLGERLLAVLEAKAAA